MRDAAEAGALGAPIEDAWLVVPLYNEATVVRGVIERAREVFPHVVAVDDGSSDASAREARAAGAVVVRHPINLGQGAALQTGFSYLVERTSARYAITFDADGQHQVKDVVRMISRLRREPLDIVVGTRFAGQDNTQVPWIKRVVLKTVVMLSPRTRRLGLSDAHNGLRAFTKKVADEMNIRMNGMSHASEIVTMIDNNGWRVDEEPVDILYTEYSMSKGQSLINGVNILADGLVARRLP